MDIEEVKSKIVNTVNLLNGVINPNRIIHVCHFDNNMNFYGLYRREVHDIVFNPEAICKEIKEKYIDSLIIFVVTHELSHVNQYIDWVPYSFNQAYFEYIEFSADINAFNFMKNYKEWLEMRLNIKIQDDFIYTQEQFTLQFANRMYMSTAHHEIMNDNKTIKWME